MRRGVTMLSCGRCTIECPKKAPAASQSSPAPDRCELVHTRRLDFPIIIRADATDGQEALPSNHLGAIVGVGSRGLLRGSTMLRPLAGRPGELSLSVDRAYRSNGGVNGRPPCISHVAESALLDRPLRSLMYSDIDRRPTALAGPRAPAATNAAPFFATSRLRSFPLDSAPTTGRVCL